uniref:Protein TIC 214 n=1 Tax=Centranthera grandiflora TaxID=2491184 RepID=A0A8A2XS86_9LAMI|nr:214 kDa protein [Centranthera grandiflora]QSX28448.1 214 kDa protein [Centranthera grandiflora]
MIFQSFLLGNLVSLCMRIINSVVVVGLYYGFLTTFSIGPSCLLLLRALVMEEGTEKKVAATTGFITGQLMMFISIYYAPLHLALGRPHTITVLALPYLFFHFFWNNHKPFFYYGFTTRFDYGSTTRNSMRNLSIQCVFLNNLIFQFFNHFILPSSMLARLVNIYMFRCNNKILFLTSSFVGWLIGYILFMKWLGLVLVWIRQNPSIRSNKYIRSKKYLVSELRNFMISILLCTTCVYYLGRMPSPIFTNKLNETPKIEQRVESEEEDDVEIETVKGTKQEQGGFTEEEEDPLSYLFIHEMEEIQVNGKEDKFHLLFTETERPVSEESYLMNINDLKDNSRFKKCLKFFEKPFLNLLFDSNRWNRPFRYIKNTRIEGTVRNEMSQYFFDICQSDGKERISFTYLPSLSIFLEMIKRRISPPTLTKSSPKKLYNPWFSINKQKSKSFTNEFLNRIKALDKGSISLNILETRTRLCNDDSTKEYLSKRYDPFLNGSSRKTIYKKFSPILKKTRIENSIEKFGINRIHGILLSDTDCQKFEQKKKKLDKKLLSTEIVEFLTSINRIIRESRSTDLNRRVLFLFSEGRIGRKFVKYLLTQIVTDVNDQKIFKKSTRIKEISKKVFRWSYKLTTLQEQEMGEYMDSIRDTEMHSRTGIDLMLLSSQEHDLKTAKNIDIEEIYVMHYPKESDFRRDVIKGSMRSQRRKMVIFEVFQAYARSPLFLDRTPKFPFYIFKNISNFITENWGSKPKEKVFKSAEEEKEEKIKKLLDEREEKKKGLESYEEAVLKRAEAWDDIQHGQAIRGCLLLIQSYFRKYILLPSLIIAKNIGRILLLQSSEWSEDFGEWHKEVHLKCTHNGVPVSGFPKNWWTEGMQIQIIFPFYLQPWRNWKPGSAQQNLIKKQNESFCFLTVFGSETEIPFGFPRKRIPFFKPIFRELKKKIKKYFRARFKGKMMLPQKLVREVEISESRKLKEEKISNQIIHESFRHSLFTKKMKDLSDQTSTILNQIERISKEKRKETPSKNHLVNKKNLDTKIFEKWKILKRENDRIISKLSLFMEFFIERIYTDIFLYNINIPKMNTEFFLELKKKVINKSISNNERKQEKMNKKKKNKMLFISKLLDIIRNSQTNSYTYYDLSSVSQAYVFYKLSQIQVSNSKKFRSLLQDQEIPFFLKPEIKDSFEGWGAVHSKLGKKKLPSYEMNQWKNWLRGHYHYNLSEKNWSKLIPEKWRNTIRQCHIVNKEIFSKQHSYEKDQLIDYKKPKKIEVLYNNNQNENFQKDYRYDLFSYKFLNYENKTECFFYISPFRGNKKQEISYMSKENLLNRRIAARKKLADRKYFDWKILNFSVKEKKKEKVSIKACTNHDTNRDQNTQILTNNYQRIYNSKNFKYKKDLSYLMIRQKNPSNSQKGFFGWMRVNKEMLKYPISNLESWFFPEFVFLYNAYKMKPWCIPSKLLLLNLNRNKKSINEKRSFLKEKEVDPLDSMLKPHFHFQWIWQDTSQVLDLNQILINHIKLYGLLFKLKDSKRITISSIRKRELDLNIMLIRNNMNFSQFMKRGMFRIEPLRLSGKKDGQFIMYQTIGISLIHKNKHQTNQKYEEQRYLSKNHFDFLVPENILSFRGRRKLRILICFNSKNRNDIDRNRVFWNEKNKKSSTQVLHDNKHLDREKNQFMKLKLFLWPNYRFEDLACMNRYWFDTNNGSRFSMLRLYLYPRLKICG